MVHLPLKLHVHLFKIYYISSKILLVGRGTIFSGTKKENKSNTQGVDSDKRP